MTFVGALDAIKASGVTPLALDENGIIWQILSWWRRRSSAAPPSLASWSPASAISATRRWSDIVANWQRLRDYTVPGAETMPGDAAFQLIAAGRRGDDDRRLLGHLATCARPRRQLGMVKMPNFSPEAPLQDGGIGGAGNGLHRLQLLRATRSEAVALHQVPDEQGGAGAQGGIGRRLA